MMTIFKGAIAALAIAGASLISTAPADAAGVGIGIYANPGYVSVNYRDRCGRRDRWGHYHRNAYCRYERPYIRAGYRHNWCWYHPYSWSCRYHRW